MRSCYLSIFLALVLSVNTGADELVFKTGGKLTGTFVKIETGKIIFDSVEVGKVTVNIANVANFTSDQPAKFVFQDGTVVSGKVLGLQNEQVKLAENDMLPAHSYALSAIASVNPPPVVPPKWSGSFTAGFTSSHGNTFSESGSVSLDASRRTEKDRTTVFTRYLVGRTETADGEDKKTNEENFAFGGKYDYFFSTKFYGFLDGQFKKDHIADLDRRIIAGVGVGYQWIESNIANFSTDFGASELCEQYTTHDVITKSDNLSARLGYHYDRILWEGFDFIHNLNYYPAATSTFSDYYLSTDAELRLALTDSMYGSFKAILDYDNTPAPGIGKTDTKYILGIGWTF
ncbi:MAG: DUF481 domain-containing protein [Planctomycetes bacterium]|nr:DUF481 domain-containing protein [Planctomycetota bacterium]